MAISSMSTEDACGRGIGEARSPWFDAYRRTHLIARSAAGSDIDVGVRRTALAFEPRSHGSPVLRIAVEFDECGSWAVVVDDVVLRYLPDAESAIHDARRLEAAPRRAAFERDQARQRSPVPPRGLTGDRSERA